MKKSIQIFLISLALHFSFAPAQAQTDLAGKMAFSRDGGIWIKHLPGGPETLLAPNGSHPKVSPDGSRIAFDFKPSRRGGTVVAIMDSVGNLLNVLDQGSFPAWSPDGTKIAYANGGIRVIDADGNPASKLQLTSHGIYPAFDPIGTKIAFCSDILDPQDIDIWWVDAAVPNTDTPLLRFVGADLDLSWSPSSQIVFTHYQDRKTSYEIYFFDPFAAPSPFNPWRLTTSLGSGLTTSPSMDLWPCWSPDGRRVAFQVSSSRSSIPSGIYVANADGSGQAQFVVEGTMPSWGP